ncbi:MAG: hypothetical protein ACR2ID_05665 [Chthoniobacterales bacterium]
METNVSQRFLMGALLLLAPCAPLQADPVSELASFSVFDKPDLAQLTGDAKPLRGPEMSTPRYLSVQTCWVAPGTPAQQAEAMRRFNPANHPEMKVLLHSSGANFARLAQAPNNEAVQALVAATQSKAPELQISRAEAARIPSGAPATMAGPIAGFWSGLLTARAQAGPFAQAPYDHTGQAIRSGDEINAMLRQQGKIQKQFNGLIGGQGETYWELLDVDGKGVLTLGSSSQRQTSGSSQMADALYYASGGYYAAVTLYQMWPVNLGGKPATLIWRGDLISSAELAELRGVERLGAESSLLKDVSKAVRIFRRDSGGGR